MRGVDLAARGVGRGVQVGVGGWQKGRRNFALIMLISAWVPINLISLTCNSDDNLLFFVTLS